MFMVRESLSLRVESCKHRCRQYAVIASSRTTLGNSFQNCTWALHIQFHVTISEISVIFGATAIIRSHSCTFTVVL